MSLRWFTSLSIFILVVSLAGCAVPSQMRSPRTLERGTVEHTLGAQFNPNPLVLGGPDYSDEGYQRPSEGIIPFTPTYGVRFGILDWLEGGVSGSLQTAGLEATAQLLETRHLDLAIGADVGWMGPPQVVVSTPLIVGLNFVEQVSLVGVAATVFAIESTWAEAGSALQFSAGLELRPYQGLTIRPHVSHLGPSINHRLDTQSWLGGSKYVVVGLDLSIGGSRGYQSSRSLE